MRGSAPLAMLASLAIPLVAGAQEATYVSQGSFDLPRTQAGLTVRDPVGLAVAPDGAIHLVDGRGSVVVFSAAGVPERSYGESELVRPLAIAIAEDGLTYVVDSEARSVFLFAADGRALGGFGTEGELGSDFLQPIDVETGPGRMVYVLDAESKSIKVFTLAGLFIRELRQPEVVEEPTAVAVAPDGTICVADRKARGAFYLIPPFDRTPWRVDVPAGTVRPVTLRGGSPSDVGSMAVNEKGSLLLLDRRQGKIWRRRLGGKGETAGSDFVYGGRGTAFGSFKEPVALAFAGVDEAVILDRELRKVERIRFEGEDDLAAMEPAETAIHITYGNPRRIPGVLVGIDAESSRVSRLLFSQEGKWVTAREAGSVPYITVYGDSAWGVGAAGGGEIAFKQQVSSVGGVAINDSMVVITDPEAGRFAVFGRTSGRLIGTFGDRYQDDRRLKRPRGIGFLPRGGLVVADEERDRVRFFSSDLATVVDSRPVSRPFGIAVDARERVLVWPRDGAPLARVAKGSPQAQLLRPPVFPARVGGLALDRGGNHFILDLDSQQIVVVGEDGGEALYAFGPEGAYEKPAGLFLDPTGNIYVPDRKAGVTHVYHWAVALPPVDSVVVTYRTSGLGLSWAARKSRFVTRYAVLGLGQHGERRILGQTQEQSLDLEVGQATGGVPSALAVEAIGISGAPGARSVKVAVPGIAVQEAAGKDLGAAAELAGTTLRQLEGEPRTYRADSSFVTGLRLVLFRHAVRTSDHRSALEQGGLLRGRVPEDYRPDFHRQMARANLAAGEPAAAASELMALASAEPGGAALADSDLVSLTFRVFRVQIARGDTAGAFAFIQGYAARIPEAAGELRAAYQDSIKVADTRVKLGLGLAQWRSLEYGAVIKFFDRLLVRPDAGLDVDQRVLCYQLLSAAYYAFGRKDEARNQYMKIFVLRPDFELESRLESIQSAYDIVIYNPDMVRFFKGLRPKPRGEG